MTMFLVAHRLADGRPYDPDRLPRGVYAIGGHVYDLAGTAERPHLYRTLKNASKVAYDPDSFMLHGGKPQSNLRSRSKIMIFDPARLLEVTEDELINTKSPDVENDIVIAERQIQLWSERLVALTTKGEPSKPPPKRRRARRTR